MDSNSVYISSCKCYDEAAKSYESSSAYKDMFDLFVRDTLLCSLSTRFFRISELEDMPAVQLH
jgi:hypothetical protein